MFLDTDDFIDNKYLEQLIMKAKKHDVVFVDVEQITMKGKVIVKEKISEYKHRNKGKVLRSQTTGKISWGRRLSV